MKTHYQVLGLDTRASYVEVEYQYHALLNDHIGQRAGRPLGKREQRKLQAVREAYLLLSSPSRRLAYDMDLRMREEEAQRRRRRVAGIGSLVCVLLGMTLLAGSVMHAMHARPAAAMFQARGFLASIMASAETSTTSNKKN